jgi:iron complex outermembrane recepter protein
MKKYIFLPIILTASFILLNSFLLSGQTDTVKTVVLNSAYVVEKKPTFNTSSRNISVLTGSDIRESGSQTLSQALSTIPGVSQLTTGAISKPVIRGLYGNRILVNMAGIRLEDQQWEDEYGLGLTGSGVERVELIKGPASLLYGSGAMGGVINIVEDDFAEPNRKSHDLNLRLFSNTLGGGLDYGFKRVAKNKFLFRISAENHADYSDGDGKQVPNTRFALYNIKAGYIIDRPRFRSENRILSSFNLFGFVADSADLAEGEEESRFSREFEEAHQQVFSTVLSSVNTIKSEDGSELKLTLGLQNNMRKEQERAESENLSLALNTVSANASYRKAVGQRFTWINGAAGMIQANKNLGTRIIVPDASIGELSLFSYLKFRNSPGKSIFNSEAGLRYDFKEIVTRETGSLNPASSVIPPFSKALGDLTASIGESLSLGSFLLKSDLSTGFRSGNLAELAANGLHEGTAFWYIGNPDMKPEQCLNLDISALWQRKWLTLRGSVFNNWFRDYIYLQPTIDKIDIYQIYRYEQSNAILKGFEAGFTAENTGRYSISADYSFLSARRTNGSWLPMEPANRIITESKLYLKQHPANWQNLFLSLGVNYTFRQKNIDISELPTPGYLIINAGAGMTVKSVRILLSCRNLTNQLYYDHLSRLKYYGLHDMGRNIILSLGWQF